MAREVLLRRLAETGLVAGAAVVVWNARLLRGQTFPVDPSTGLITPDRNGRQSRRQGASGFTAAQNFQR